MLSSFAFLGSFLHWYLLFSDFDSLLNNFTIFLYICDVPIINVSHSYQKAWNWAECVRMYSLSLLNFRGFARKDSDSILYSPIHLLVLPPFPFLLALSRRKVSSLGKRGLLYLWKRFEICGLMFPLALAEVPECCYHSFKRMFKKNLKPRHRW